MCVIAICEPGKRPTEAQVRQMFSANPDGAGLAWSSGKKVKYAKGLMHVGEVLSVMTDVPKAARLVLHFRISTVGGTVPQLTHPFIVSEASPVEKLRGVTDAVWFHNGHWSDWESALLQSTISTPGGVVPEGPLSDSRAMAVIAYRHSERVMQLIPKSQRTVWMNHETVYHAGNGWTKVGDLLVSNTGWMSAPRLSWQRPVTNHKATPGTIWRGSKSYARPEPERDTFDAIDDAMDHALSADDIALLDREVANGRGQRGLFTNEMQRVQKFLESGVDDGDEG